MSSMRPIENLDLDITSACSKLRVWWILIFTYKRIAKSHWFYKKLSIESISPIKELCLTLFMLITEPSVQISVKLLRWSDINFGIWICHSYISNAYPESLRCKFLIKELGIINLDICKILSLSWPIIGFNRFRHKIFFWDFF